MTPRRTPNRSGRQRHGGWRRKRLALIGGGAIGLLGIAVLVAVMLPAGGSQPPTGQAVESEASFRWPSETLTDWAGFADQLSVVTVVDERDLPPPPGQDPRADDGYIAREVTLRVERTLWRRPEARAKADGLIRIVALGSAQNADGKQTPFTISGAARFEVGQRYLVPLIYAVGADESRGRAASPEWAVLAETTILTLEANTVTSRVAGGEPSAAAQALKGTTLERAGEIIQGTAPSPAAERNAELGPDARSDAVQRAGE